MRVNHSKTYEDVRSLEDLRTIVNDHQHYEEDNTVVLIQSIPGDRGQMESHTITVVSTVKT